MKDPRNYSTEMSTDYLQEFPASNQVTTEAIVVITQEADDDESVPKTTSRKRKASIKQDDSNRPEIDKKLSKGSINRMAAEFCSGMKTNKQFQLYFYKSIIGNTEWIS